MGYIAGIVDKNGEDASDRLLKMLQSASKGPAHSFGVGNYQDLEIFKEEPEFTSIQGASIIGSKNIHVENPEPPLNQGSESFIFKGMLFDNDGPDSLEVGNILEGSPVEGLRELISNRLGVYAVAVASKNEVICGLDHVGTIPIYYGETGDHCAISTNKKMLWALDAEATPLEPGSILRMSKNGVQITKVKQLGYTKPITGIEDQTLDNLHRLFTEVSERLVRKTCESAVAFSAGVDSTLVAHYLSQTGSEPKLITTGLEGQKELDIAEKTASHYGWDIDIEAHTEEDVESSLDEVIRSVEEPHPMKIGIAYPFHWSAKTAYSKGHTSLYSGNGADELFGGYKRYHTSFLEGKDVDRMVFDDTTGSWVNNFHRDTKTCLDQGVSLILPFTHPSIIDFGLSIPSSSKVSSDPTCIRKLVLRKLAKKVGIIDEIADRPKKAAQYSTGVDKALRRIAKRKGFSLRELVQSRFNEISRG